MPSMTHTNPGASPKPRARSRRRRAGALVAGALLTASLAVTACGGSESPTILNTEKVERAIEAASLAQRDEHVTVSCPSGVHQKKGLRFSCTATGTRGPVAERASTRFAVVEMDDAGRVRFDAR